MAKSYSLSNSGNGVCIFPAKAVAFNDETPNSRPAREGTKRVFALAEEPEVFRIWMPEEDCPGLAMARGFGDFCLKDYGLISVPHVSYRKLNKNDKFVVLATDGVSQPGSTKSIRGPSVENKVDDCALVCLFLKRRTTLARTFSEVSRVSMNHTELAENYSEVSKASIHRSEIATVARVDSQQMFRKGESSSNPRTNIHPSILV